MHNQNRQDGSCDCTVCESIRRLVQRTAERFYLRVFWGSGVHGQQYGYHNAQNWQMPDGSPIADFSTKDLKPDEPFPNPIVEAKTEAEYHNYDLVSGKPHFDDLWPKKCETCGEPAPPFKTPGVTYQFFYETLYDDPPRPRQTGDMYWAWWMPRVLDKRGHLMVICPGGGNYKARVWDTMSEATNCPHPDKKGTEHSCWTRSGEPPNCSITPSIMIGDYHGYLTNGEFNP